MCGRYVLVQKIDVVEKRFGVSAPEGLEFDGGVNIGPGRMAPVITGHKPNQLQLFGFGLSPFWAKKRMYLFNARAEGDSNSENDPMYSGAQGIIKKPSFRKPIRYQRCIIPADAFIEGSTKRKLDEPHLVYLNDRKAPFAFAGIWDEWVNKDTGEVHQGFAIITTRSNSLLQKIPHHRSPVILKPEEEALWLNPDLPLAEVTALLRPYPGEAMNAFPISKAIKNPRNEGLELIQPMGEALEAQTEIVFSTEIELQGMGRKRRES